MRDPLGFERTYDKLCAALRSLSDFLLITYSPSLIQGSPVAEVER